MANLNQKQQSGNNPWVDKANDSYLLREIEVVKNSIKFPNSEPDEAIEYLCNNKLESQLFSALGQLARMYPLIAYDGEPSIYLSPPLSGAGNCVVVVMGKYNGIMRMVGCNYCDVSTENNINKSATSFWTDFDASNFDNDKCSLMSKFVHENFNDLNLQQAKQVDSQCHIYRTMPLYIACIDSDQVHIWSMPCVIWPKYRPSKMSFEMVQEFK